MAAAAAAATAAIVAALGSGAPVSTGKKRK